MKKSRIFIACIFLLSACGIEESSLRTTGDDEASLDAQSEEGTVTIPFSLPGQAALTDDSVSLPPQDDPEKPEYPEPYPLPNPNENISFFCGDYTVPPTSGGGHGEEPSTNDVGEDIIAAAYFLNVQLTGECKNGEAFAENASFSFYSCSAPKLKIAKLRRGCKHQLHIKLATPFEGTYKGSSKSFGFNANNIGIYLKRVVENKGVTVHIKYGETPEESL